ncbi:hypothetical protein SEA_FAUST_173 [Streptomyces phage Faust]|uniref:Uncharacterized protein n=1 Tax=Streptomyces phage Faust TaxID=2767565 RepID=A0A7G9UYZ5_9CAUD|nr:hypothetical protein PP456_gp109 [Streptomyces phage Faust]QNN99250.1 hypothetical protein SEA_FAUST_173 [Streptomyces phage Faust]
MAFYQVTSFYYDESTGNIFIQLAKEAEVSYEHAPEEQPQDIYEAQIYLDGGTNLVGKYRPSSMDGTITGGHFGRQAGTTPDTTPVQPLENAPE